MTRDARRTIGHVSADRAILGASSSAGMVFKPEPKPCTAPIRQAHYSHAPLRIPPVAPNSSPRADYLKASPAAASLVSQHLASGFTLLEGRHSVMYSQPEVHVTLPRQAGGNPVAAGSEPAADDRAPAKEKRTARSHAKPWRKNSVLFQSTTSQWQKVGLGFFPKKKERSSLLKKIAGPQCAIASQEKLPLASGLDAKQRQPLASETRQSSLLEVVYAAVASKSHGDAGLSTSAAQTDCSGDALHHSHRDMQHTEASGTARLNNEEPASVASTALLCEAGAPGTLPAVSTLPGLVPPLNLRQLPPVYPDGEHRHISQSTAAETKILQLGGPPPGTGSLEAVRDSSEEEHPAEARTSASFLPRGSLPRPIGSAALFTSLDRVRTADQCLRQLDPLRPHSAVRVSAPEPPQGSLHGRPYLTHRSVSTSDKTTVQTPRRYRPEASPRSRSISGAGTARLPFPDTSGCVRRSDIAPLRGGSAAATPSLPLKIAPLSVAIQVRQSLPGGTGFSNPLGIAWTKQMPTQPSLDVLLRGQSKASASC